MLLLLAARRVNRPCRFGPEWKLYCCAPNRSSGFRWLGSHAPVAGGSAR